jgi:hypothetical protein
VGAQKVRGSDKGLEPLELVPVTADRVAGIIAGGAGIAFGVVSITSGWGAAFGLAVGALLLLLARAAFARKVTADATGLSFHDGVWLHRLRWDEVEGVLAAEGGVYLLHDGRYINRLPLPGTRFGHSAANASIADRLTALRLATGGDEASVPCPVRIEGGLRWRLGTTIVRVEPNGSLTYLSGPRVLVGLAASIDLVGTLLRLSSKRDEAEQLREAEAQRVGWNSA